MQSRIQTPGSQTAECLCSADKRGTNRSSRSSWLTGIQGLCIGETVSPADYFSSSQTHLPEIIRVCRRTEFCNSLRRSGDRICRSSGSPSCSMLAIGCCLRPYAQAPPFTDLGWSMWAFTCLLPIHPSRFGIVTNRSLQASGDNCDLCQYIYDLGL